jgi:hypothetical protein
VPIRDWPKQKLVKLWVGGTLLEAVLLIGPLVLQPSAETLDRRALALQDSVRAGMGPAINLDTLSIGQRDSLVSLARSVR